MYIKVCWFFHYIRPFASFILHFPSEGNFGLIFRRSTSTGGLVAWPMEWNCIFRHFFSHITAKFPPPVVTGGGNLSTLLKTRQTPSHWLLSHMPWVVFKPKQLRWFSKQVGLNVEYLPDTISVQQYPVTSAPEFKLRQLRIKSPWYSANYQSLHNALLKKICN